MAQRFAVGTGNWNNNASWVGGAQPTAADDIIIPSGAVITIPTGVTALGRSLEVQSGGTLAFAATTSTLNLGDGTAGAGNSIINISSGATITLTANGTINLISTSSTQQTITINGKTLPNLTLNGSGSSYLLADNLVCNNFSHLQGIFNTNSNNMTAVTYETSGTGTRTLTLGSSTITITRTNSTAFNCTNPTNLTVTSNTATLVFSGTSFGATIALGGINWNGLSITVSSLGTGFMSGGGTIKDLIITGSAVKTAYLSLTAGISLVCTGLFECDGNTATNRVLLRTTVTGQNATISAASVSCSNLDIMDINGAGSGNWDLSAITGLSGDCGGNSGITFTTATSCYWVPQGGTATGSWSNSSKWASSSGGTGGTARVPLAQDDVYIDANSVDAGSRTITLDMPRVGKNVSFLGVTNNPTITWTTSLNQTFFGDVTFVSGITFSFGNTVNWVLAGRGNFTFDSAGKNFTGTNMTTTVDAGSGSYSLSSAYTTGHGFVVTSGGFDSASYSVTSSTFVSTSTFTRNIDISGSIWTLTSTSGTPWNLSTTGLTFNGAGSEIVISTASSSLRTLALGGAKYGEVTYVVNGSTGALTFTGANYFETLNFSDATNARSLNLPISVVTTIKNLNTQGASGRLVTIQSATPGTAAFLELVGPVSTVDWLTVTDVVSTISYKFYAGANSSTTGVTSGVILTAPVSQAYISRTAQVAVAAGTSRAHDFPFGQQAVAGEKLVVIAGFSGNPGTVTGPSGYTLVPGNPSQGTTSPYSYVWEKTAVGGETGVSYSWTNSVNNNSAILALVGVNGTPELDVYDKNNSGASTVTTLITGSGVTPTTTPGIAIATWLGNNTLGSTTSINDNFLETRQATAVIAMKMAARPVASAVSISPTMVWATSRVSASQLVIFKDVAGGVAHSETPADSVTITDDAVKSVGKPLSDSVTVTDSATKQVTAGKSDTVTITDGAIRIVSIVIYDSVTISDALTKSVTKPAADSVTISDEALNDAPDAYEQAASDSVSISDSVKIRLNGRSIWYRKATTSFANQNNSSWYANNSQDWSN